MRETHREIQNERETERYKMSKRQRETEKDRS